MSRRKLTGMALFSVFLVAVAALSPIWGANLNQARRPITYQDAKEIRERYTTVFPHLRLQNIAAAHYQHLQDTYKTLAAAGTPLFGREAEKVNFRLGWHPKPYSTPTENTAMFQLGVLAGMGHFGLVNANIPEMKENGLSMLRLIAKITDSTYLSDLSPEVNAIIQAVSDPTYNGGPTRTLDRYDALMAKIGDRVFGMYLKDGFWYYTAGSTLAGLHVVPGRDWFNAPYFRDMLQLLYNHYPSTGLPFAERWDMVQILRSDFNGRTCTATDQDWARRAIWELYPFNPST